MGDRDGIRLEGSHRRGCGSMQEVDCWRWAIFTRNPKSVTGEKHTSAVETRHPLYLDRFFRWIEGETWR